MNQVGDQFTRRSSGRGLELHFESVVVEEGFETGLNRGALKLGLVGEDGADIRFIFLFRPGGGFGEGW